MGSHTTATAPLGAGSPAEAHFCRGGFFGLRTKGLTKDTDSTLGCPRYLAAV